MAKRTCFVVSPIGDEGSDTRRQADDLFDLVLGPGLEPFAFDLVRADRIPGSGVITTEIIELVQSAELCVIDLTGHNANVYYECGRRHETGRPYVQLIQRGETIPFDLAGIRTIIYDLSTPRGVFDATKALRRFVEEHVKSGFQSAQTGASMATLAAGLERLERKVDRVVSQALVPSGVSTGATGDDPAKKFSKDPRIAIAEAIAVRELDYAASLLPGLEQRAKSADEVLVPAALLAREGYEVGAQAVARVLDGPIENLDPEELKAAVAAYVSFLNLTDTEAQGLDLMRDVTARIIEKHGLSGCEEAYFLNQLQRALAPSGGEEPDDPIVQEALALSLRVTELCPDDPSYWFNLSMNYERRGLDDLALSAVDRYMEMGADKDLSAAHLFQAVDLYIKAEREDDARRAFEQLRVVSPPRAQLMLGNPRVARIMGIEV